MPIGVWGTYGPGPGQFNYPRWVALDGHGNIYVSDSYNHRIQMLSPTGALLAELGSRGGMPGEFRRPEGLLVDDTGSIVVVDADNNRLQRYVPSPAPTD